MIADASRLGYYQQFQHPRKHWHLKAQGTGLLSATSRLPVATDSYLDMTPSGPIEFQKLEHLVED